MMWVLFILFVNLLYGDNISVLTPKEKNQLYKITRNYDKSEKEFDYIRYKLKRDLENDSHNVDLDLKVFIIRKIKMEDKRDKLMFTCKALENKYKERICNVD